jgi:hypothetical protein
MRMNSLGDVILDEPTDIGEYWDLLDGHDWYFNYSDAAGVYKRGSQVNSFICEIARKRGGEYAQLLRAFNLHYFSGKPWGTEKAPKPDRPGTPKQETKQGVYLSDEPDYGGPAQPNSESKESEMNYEEMSIPQLTTAYNSLAAKAGAKVRKGFKTKEEGVEACKKLAAGANGAGATTDGASDFGEKVDDKAAPAKPGRKKGEKVVKAPREIPTLTKESPVADFLQAFGTREGTNREALVKHLAKNLGKMVDSTKLAKAVYDDEEAVPQMTAVMRGAEIMINNNNLPLEISNVGAKEFGLFMKGEAPPKVAKEKKAPAEKKPKAEKKAKAPAEKKVTQKPGDKTPAPV